MKNLHIFSGKWELTQPSGHCKPLSRQIKEVFRIRNAQVEIGKAIGNFGR